MKVFAALMKYFEDKETKMSSSLLFTTVMHNE